MEHWLALERICNLLENENISVSTYFSDKTRRYLPKFVQKWIAPAGIEYTKFQAHYSDGNVENDLSIYAYENKIIVLRGNISDNTFTRFNVTKVTKLNKWGDSGYKPRRSDLLIKDYPFEEDSSIWHMYFYFRNPVQIFYGTLQDGSIEIVVRWFFRNGEFTYLCHCEKDQGVSASAL